MTRTAHLSVYPFIPFNPLNIFGAADWTKEQT